MQSVFVLVGLHDSLDVELRPGSTLSREDHLMDNQPPLPDDDLVIKAARLLQRATGCTSGAHIRLTKRVPSQAGLGGGSSDAASALLALNRLWNTGLDRTALMALGGQLGADVPFFLFGQNAWAEGIGDQLTAVRVPTVPVLIVKPAAGLETPTIFNDPGLKRDSERHTIEGFAELDAVSKLGFGSNHLQPVAEKHSSELGQCLQWLKDKGLNPRMSGSGTAVFAFDAKPLGFLSLPSEWFACETNILSEHPLRDWVS